MARIPGLRRLSATRVFSLLFLIMICSPLTLHLTRGSVGVLWDEQRIGASFPELPSQKRSLRSFTHDLDGYLKDNFGFRGWLLTQYHLLKYRLFGDYETGSAHVLFGKHGWLFYTQHGQIDHARGRRVPSFKLMEEWAARLKAQHDAAVQRGATYLAVVAPNKNSIYPEMLPTWAQRPHGMPAIDTVIEFIRARHPEIAVLDLRSAIRANRRLPMFVATDLHWTEPAGYVASKTIVEFLRQRYPELPEPKRLSDYVITESLDVGGDLAAHINLRSILREYIYPMAARNGSFVPPSTESQYLRLPQLSPSHPTVVYKNDAAQLRLVVFRNSFFNVVHKFIAPHFRETVIFWREFEPSYVDAVKPDIVIRQFLEMELLAE